MLISFDMRSEKNTVNTNKKRLRRRITASILLLIPQVLFLFFSPLFFKDKLNTDPYREWMQFKREPAVSVIKVWHIASFKPYVGSLGKWLEDTASVYSAAYIGIYFEVSSFSPEEANEQLSRGSRPDVLSFSGDCPVELLQCLFVDEIGVEAEALPYCASGKVLVYEPEKLDLNNLDENIEKAGSAEEFKKGKTDCCVCDIRAAGDLVRAQLLGKCPYFEVEPIEADKNLVQFIGVLKDTDNAKLPYAIGFIEAVLSLDRQSALGQLGLIPADTVAEVKYDEQWLDRMRNIINESGVLSPIIDN